MHRALLVTLYSCSSLLLLTACGGQVEDALDDAASEAVTACGSRLAVKAVSASGAQDGNPASHAVDGDLSTRWSSKGVGQYLTADLGTSMPVCSVSLAFFEGTLRKNKLVVSTSTDGRTFRSVFTGTSSGSSNALETYAVSAGSARYVRVTLNGNSLNTWASVTELAITGSPAGFVHPGILSSKASLDYVKAKIAAKQQPWTGMLAQAQASGYGKLTYSLHTPVPVAICGNKAYPSDVGCQAALDDALAAYTQTLIWYFTGDTRYATSAIRLLDAWSSKLKDVKYDPNDQHTYGGPLYAAWMGELFPRSAELLRYGNVGWSSAGVAQFAAMLNGAILPHVRKGWNNIAGANWIMSMADATMNIGIFTDSRAVYDEGLAVWRQRLPGSIYLVTDGAEPIVPPDFLPRDAGWPGSLLAQTWFQQNEWENPRENGITQETCRDLSHTQMGLASMIDAAETGYLQGTNLYAEQETRMLAAHEFVAHWLNTYPGSTPHTVASPAWLCRGALNAQDVATWEIAYNHFHGRKGISMPETEKTIERQRTTTRPYTNLQMSWEGLTHAGTN